MVRWYYFFKRVNSIVVIIFIIFFMVFMSVFYQKTKKHSLEDLCGHSKNEIYTVLINDSYGTIEDILQYYNGYFKQYTESLGNTAHRTFSLYDKNNKLLFEIKDMGNNNIVRLTGQDVDAYYQFFEKS